MVFLWLWLYFIAKISYLVKGFSEWIWKITENLRCFLTYISFFYTYISTVSIQIVFCIITHKNSSLLTFSEGLFEDVIKQNSVWELTYNQHHGWSWWLHSSKFLAAIINFLNVSQLVMQWQCLGCKDFVSVWWQPLSLTLVLPLLSFHISGVKLHELDGS